jgi:D-galactose 1-dehydrogenase
LDLRCANGVPIHAEFDFRQTGPQLWNIEIKTDAGVLTLSCGGAVMHVDGQLALAGTNREYPRLYAQFARLIREQNSDADLAPLELVTAALATGALHAVDAFD